MSKDKATKKSKVLRILLIALGAILLIYLIVVAVCLSVSRPAVQPLSAYQETYGDAVITVADDGGVEILPANAEGAKVGVLFYIGAQIEPSAYIPLLARLAEEGYPCFVPNLTFHMAALEPGAAEPIIEEHPEIETWFIAGHSMGGLTASGFAEDHSEEIDGLILIAAYTNRDMSEEDMPTLSIYGDADGVINQKLYDQRLTWYSADFEEHILAGANHAQYGDYGEQPRDRDAGITAEEQQDQTAELILDWLSRHAAEKENAGV